MSDEETFIPPATFDFLVMSLRAQAEIQLGLMHFGPETERPEPKLPLARHAIDMLGMLQEKTRGNLSWDEQRALDNTLTELRFLYVQAADRAAKQVPGTGAAAGAAASE